MAKFKTKRIDGQATADWPAIHLAAAKNEVSVIEVKEYSEAAEISAQQRKWWKGVLLPELAKDTGDTVSVWETRLKLVVMPDEFAPETVTIAGKSYTFIPSITKLSMAKLNKLIEGSVSHLRNERIYGDHFLWVDLPDKAKRKNKETVKCS